MGGLQRSYNLLFSHCTPPDFHQIPADADSSTQVTLKYIRSYTTLSGDRKTLCNIAHIYIQDLITWMRKIIKIQFQNQLNRDKDY